MPVARDIRIGYRYVHPSSGLLIDAGYDDWLNAKGRIAAIVARTGQETFTVYGGSGERHWHRIIVCTRAEAEAFLAETTRP